MSTSLVINGAAVQVPSAGDTDWAANLIATITALAASVCSIIMFGNASGGAGLTYLAPGLLSGPSGGTEVFMTAPVSGRLKRLYVKAVSAPSGGNITYVVRINGVNTALQCTLTAGNTVASDVVDSIAVNAGDRISVSSSSGASSQPTFPVITFALIAS